MSNQIAVTEAEYRDQLNQLVGALVEGRFDDLAPELSPESRREDADDFLANCREKRCERLLRHLEPLGAAFPDLVALVSLYVVESPLKAYDRSPGDDQSFLRWLSQRLSMTPEQTDHVACQQARQTVLHRAGKRRQAHVRFQARWARGKSLARSLFTDPKLRVFLNPVRVWTTLSTPGLLGQGATLPQPVVFFPKKDQIAATALAYKGRALMNTLARLAPCTIDQFWALNGHSSRKELVEYVHDLVAVGLAALGK